MKYNKQVMWVQQNKAINELSQHTRKHCLDIPGNDCIQERVEHHHNEHHKQIEPVALYRGDMDVVPLHTISSLLIECKVFTSQTKRCRGE